MDIEQIIGTGIGPECMRCLLDKAVGAYPDNAPWQEQAEYLRRVLRIVADGSDSLTAPEIAQQQAAVLKEMFGIERDLTKEKHRFNQLVLGLEDVIGRRIAESDDPLGFAIRCALVGNFIDFGPTGDVSETKLLQLIDEAPHMRLDVGALAELEGRIREAHTIAFLTDNCGEVVLDKLLIGQILHNNPQAQVTAIVRGAPTSNDATMEDALEVGLDTVCEVLGNGSDLAGTSPSRVNKRTRNALAHSDLVIAKGLANYETLSGRGANTRFLFLCKCALYQHVFDVPLHTGLIVAGV